LFHFSDEDKGMSAGTIVVAILAGGALAALLQWPDGFVVQKRGEWAASQRRWLAWIGRRLQDKPFTCAVCLPCWTILLALLAVDPGAILRDIPIISFLFFWMAGIGAYFGLALCAAAVSGSFVSARYGHLLYELTSFLFPILADAD
jgi:hypothetical protein